MRLTEGKNKQFHCPDIVHLLEVLANAYRIHINAKLKTYSKIQVCEEKI
jgi:hypothetical protein